MYDTLVKAWAHWGDYLETLFTRERSAIIFRLPASAFLFRNCIYSCSFVDVDSRPIQAEAFSTSAARNNSTVCVSDKAELYVCVQWAVFIQFILVCWSFVTVAFDVFVWLTGTAAPSDFCF